MSYLCQKCKKNLRGHRLRFRDKAYGKLPRFRKIVPYNTDIIEHGLQGFTVKNIEGESTEANDLSHVL